MGGTIIRTALALTAEQRWKGTRSERAALCLAEDAVGWLEAAGVTDPDAITTAHLGAYVATCQARGNRPATIIRKLSTLRTLVDVAIAAHPPLAMRPLPRYRVAHPKPRKWWLTDDARRRLCAWLRGGGRHMGDFADFLEFTCYTGLRVEEALALRPGHFHGLDNDTPRVTVPGSKTDNAARTIALSDEAAAIAVARLNGGDGRLFPWTYWEARSRWQMCREWLGEADNPTATLKAVRRSFARIATDKGMPTEVLRDYMGHGDIKTTAGYLRLVGGYDAERVRQWL